MISFLDKLNLRPQEKRLVVAIAIVLFVVLNIWFVWPHFNDWQDLKGKKLQAEKTLRTYEAEIARVPAHKVRLRELESAGSSVVQDEQELNLARTVETQSRANGVTITRQGSRPQVSSGQTNQFFEEQSIGITINANNEELVNFLTSIASTNSLIRVRDMSLKPDPSGTRLVGDLTLVASYQRKKPVEIKPAQPVTKPVTASSPPAKTNAPSKAAATNLPAVGPRAAKPAPKK